jgi:hypothetical protein
LVTGTGRSRSTNSVTGRPSNRVSVAPGGVGVGGGHGRRWVHVHGARPGSTSLRTRADGRAHAALGSGAGKKGDCGGWRRCVQDLCCAVLCCVPPARTPAPARTAQGVADGDVAHEVDAVHQRGVPLHVRACVHGGAKAQGHIIKQGCECQADGEQTLEESHGTPSGQPYSWAAPPHRPQPPPPLAHEYSCQHPAARGLTLFHW